MKKTIEFINRKNERIVIELTVTEHDKGNKNGLMNLWIKHGYMTEFIPETINIMVYVYDESGNCWGKYNPQIIKGENKINFKWMLANTPENEKKIIREIKRRANR
mgnify:CR=1 FL=1